MGNLLMIKTDPSASASPRGEPSPEVPEPVYKQVEAILDEHSAWVARPNAEVTRKVALAATIAVLTVIEKMQEPRPTSWPDEEAVARAVCVARGLNPDCLHQGEPDEGAPDGYWSQQNPFTGELRQVPWHYGWRKHLPVARAILALFPSPAEIERAAYERGLEDAARLVERDEFDATVRLNPAKHKHLSDWFHDQQASAIRALRTKGGE